MTEDKHKSNDKFLLAENPFSPDHEVTIIQTSPPIEASATDDEITEVTEATELTISPIDTNETPPSIETQAEPTTQPFRITSSWPLKKTLKYFACLALLILSVPLIEQTARHFASRTIKRHSVKPVAAQPIRLGPVHINQPKQASSGLPSVKSGGFLFLSIPIESWPTSNHELKFEVDFNIYSHRGELLHFVPDQVNFNGQINSKREKLIISERVSLSREISPGLYRVKIVVREKTSGKSAVAETRFRVVP